MMKIIERILAVVLLMIKLASIAVVTERTKSITSAHKYDSTGYCTKRKVEYKISEKKITGTFNTVRNDFPIRSRPYFTDTIAKRFPQESAVTEVGNGINFAENLWYRRRDGTWIFSDNFS